MERFRSLATKVSAITAGIVVPFGTVLAQLSDDDGLGSTGLKSGTGNVKTTIANILNYVLTFLGLIAVILIIIAGFKYMTSQGDEKKTDSAKKTILYTVIGLIVIILARVIVNFVLKDVAQIAG